MNTCRPITLKTIDDARGALYVVEGEHDVPFSVKRVFYVVGMTQGSPRGDHAHRLTHQAIFCVSGQVECVTKRPGAQEATWKLDTPSQGIHLPPFTWVVYQSLVSNSVCLVLASEHYDPDDYLRDANAFDRDFSE